MDLTQFPITPEMAYTVAGAAAICVVLTQLLKGYLKDWRFTNLLGWVVTLAIVELGAVAFIETDTPLLRAYNAFLISIAGAALATLGYETLSNLLGKAGIGPRSE